MNLEQFDLMLLKYLADSSPETKHKLWQQTRHGMIVGFYFNSNEIALESDLEPGWQYVCERDGEHVIVPEDQV